AAFRHALLAGMFGAIAALPVVSAVAPPVRIAIRAARGRNFPAPVVRPGAGAPIVIRPAGAPTIPPYPGRPLSDLLLTCWIAGTALTLAPVGLGLAQIRRLRRSGLP